MGKSEVELKNDRAARSVGVCQLSMGIIAGIVFMGVPLHQAINAGRHTSRLLLLREENASVLNALFSLTLVVAAIAGAIYFEKYLESFGYDF